MIVLITGELVAGSSRALRSYPVLCACLQSGQALAAAGGPTLPTPPPAPQAEVLSKRACGISHGCVALEDGGIL